jgi:hypothetical protein
MTSASCIPSTLTAGDSVHWMRQFAAYPASAGWALSYSIVGPTAVYTVNATPNGDAFAVDVSATATKDWTPGAYRVAEILTRDPDRITLGATRLVIAPDLSAAPATGLDTRSNAQRTLDAIDAWMATSAPVAGAYEINGRRIQYYPIADLLKLRDRYAAIVAREQAAECGHAGSPRILVRL